MRAPRDHAPSGAPASVVVHRGVTVRIYGPLRDRKREVYLLAYYAGSRRAKETLKGSLKEAERKAKELCNGITAGEIIDALHLTPLDRRVYITAKEAAAKVGRAVDQITRDAVEAQLQLGAVSLLEAAKFWKLHHNAALPSATVSQVVDELLAFIDLQVQNKRRSQVHHDTLRTPLRAFARVFQVPIGTVTKPEIETWLNRLNYAPRTLDNYRSSLLRLFNFARGRYLPEEGKTAIERVAAVHHQERGEIEIFKPWELAPLFAAIPIDLLPCLALGAFAGLRNAEICRLEWSAVRLLEKTGEYPHGFIEIKKSTAKQHRTASRRIVPIQLNLARWLEPYIFRSGPVAPYRNQSSLSRAVTGEIRKLNATRKKQRLPLLSRPKNGARHAYGSYRLPVLKSAAALALEMGNSEKEVFDAYREVVTPSEVETWWNLVPIDLTQLEFPALQEP